MKYLLDTCVISELLRPEPNKQVTDWIENTDESSLYVSVLTIGELCKGISKLPDSKKKTDIWQWMEYDFQHRFKGRILGINEKIAETWGEIQADAEKQGRKMPAIDSLLAATEIFHGLILVTRNVSDVGISPVSVFNLWNVSKRNNYEQ